MPKKLTHEEFLERFYAKSKNAENIEILEQYKGNKTKIKVRCKIDGYEWNTRPNDLITGYGCPKCAGRNKTTEDFKQELEKINNNIEVIGEYVNNRTKIKCRCKIDGHEFEKIPSNLLQGQGCPKCVGKIRNKTTEYFINELKQINDNIEVLGEYKGVDIRIKVKCIKDDYEWETTPHSLLSGTGCPKCSGVKRKNTEEFKQEIKLINNDIKILGEYVNSSTKIKCKCKVDGYEWSVTPSHLLNGVGCPKCNESKGEKRVAKYLDSRNIEYERQYKFNDCRSKNKLPFDFYIPSKNIAIEYDGEDHYMIIFRSKNNTYERAFNKFVGTKVRDTIKTKYCKDNNIKLIRIPYWDFDRIEEILKEEV